MSVSELPGRMMEKRVTTWVFPRNADPQLKNNRFHTTYPMELEDRVRSSALVASPSPTPRAVILIPGPHTHPFPLPPDHSHPIPTPHQRDQPPPHPSALAQGRDVGEPTRRSDVVYQSLVVDEHVREGMFLSFFFGSVAVTPTLTKNQT
jgi:hypothetical protein